MSVRVLGHVRLTDVGSATTWPGWRPLCLLFATRRSARYHMGTIMHSTGILTVCILYLYRNWHHHLIYPHCYQP